MRKFLLWATGVIAALFIALLVLIGSGIYQAAQAADAPPTFHARIFVTVFWLKPQVVHGQVVSITIDSVDFGGMAPDPQTCATLPMAEVLKPISATAAQKIAAGLIPKVVCGMAAPEPQPAAKARAPAEKPPVRSEPGNGSWDHGPSGGI